MGMDANMLACIRALAENRIQDAKKEAICCCLNDTTKKNESQTTYYKKLLENGSAKMLELPVNLQGLLYMQDMSDFNEKRYYLGNAQKELFSKIENGVNITTKMMEYGIPYMNSTLIFGIPGTGKTEFAKYVAYKLNLPYAYIKFSYLIDSYLGKTAQNLNRIFDYCKGQKCVLMLDEIDCIGLARGNDTGVDGELGRTTIALMQLLDELVEGNFEEATNKKKEKVYSVEEIEHITNKYFQGSNIKTGIVTGRMKETEKSEIINGFQKNEFQILIATTIIEVGVNVPNTTVIGIINANRFGLAGLHQLRGRVGRNSLQSYCILQSEDKNNPRLRAMCQTTNGFEIAEEDLRLRGTGDIVGIQQSGLDINVMMMLKYPRLYNAMMTYITNERGK